MSRTKSREKWYAGGLHFSCTQCGNCCTGPPGFVWVKRWEIDKIATFIGREGKGLTQQHLRRVGVRYSLTERVNGDCCFLKTEGGKRICSIYPVRPLQCRTWPFWGVNLRSSSTWNEAAVTCPGINKGEHHELVQIQTHRNAKRWEDVAP
ncbi:MAG: YkgJ family cysteine cluster protein [Planctomycetota bacterium]|nr:YkgJ family cysteine cluster protein [Planctomycetota bacterium]